MKFQQNVFALIKRFSGQENIFVINRLFAEVTGSLAGGAFLSQLLYWSDRTKDPDGWFHKSDEEWKKEIFVGRRVIERYRAMFKEAGFLETDVRKTRAGTPKTHYRIDQYAFLEWLGEKMETIEPDPTDDEPEEEEEKVKARAKAVRKLEEIAGKAKKPKKEEKLHKMPKRTQSTTGVGWQADLNKKVPAKDRLPLVDKLAEIHGLKELIDIGSDDTDLLPRLHRAAVALWEGGTQSVEDLNRMFDAWIKEDWRGKKKQLPNLSRNDFVIFVSQRKQITENPLFAEANDEKEIQLSNYF